MTDDDKKKLLSCAVKTGAALLSNGAEIYRVEETVRLLASAFGAGEVSVFAIPSFLSVTVSFADGDEVTSGRRVSDSATDMTAVDEINALCRRAVGGELTPEEYEQKLGTVLARRKYSDRLLAPAHLLVAAFFCLFFGGSAFDALSAAVCGLVIFLVTDFMARHESNRFFTCVAAAAACSTAAVLLSLPGWGTSTEAVIIGSLMLLVPGVAITNFMRNLIAGDVLSGLIKLGESLMIACGVALGAGIPVAVYGVLGGAVV